MKFILSEGEGMDGTVVHACVISVAILLKLHEESLICMHKELLNWHLKYSLLHKLCVALYNSLCGVSSIVEVSSIVLVLACLANICWVM